MNPWPALGSVAGLLGVVLGAFGAHALRDRLTPDMATVWNTAVQYQFWHALALLAVGLLLRHTASAWLHVAGGAFVAGIVLFSGSLYVLALTGVRVWGAVTPVGGVALIVGWGCLVVFAVRDAG